MNFEIFFRWGVMRGEVTTMSNIVDGAFSENCWRLKAAHHFYKSSIVDICVSITDSSFFTQLFTEITKPTLHSKVLHPLNVSAKSCRSMEALNKVFFWKYETPTYENLTSQTGYKCPFKETRLVKVCMLHNRTGKKSHKSKLPIYISHSKY